MATTEAQLALVEQKRLAALARRAEQQGQRHQHQNQPGQQQGQQGRQGQQAQGRPFQTTDAFKELAEAQAKKRAECKSDTICRCKIFAEGCAAAGLETGPSDRYPLHPPATYCKEYGLCGDDLPEHLREPTEVSLLNLRIPAGDK